jgi:hypothetical protein
MRLEDIWPLLLPIIVVQLALMAIALRDLLREERRVRGGNKGLWAVVIVFGQLLGPLAYLAFGRLEE